MKLTIGIDPGKGGGVAWTFGNDVHVKAMPDTEGDLRDFLNGVTTVLMEVVVVIEDIPVYVPMPGTVPVAKQVSTAAKLHDNFGFLKGFLMARGAAMHTVKPQKWQKDLGIGTKSGKPTKVWKNQLKNEAQKRFPGVKVTLATSDALLLLDYGTRHSL